MTEKRLNEIISMFQDIGSHNNLLPLVMAHGDDRRRKDSTEEDLVTAKEILEMAKMARIRKLQVKGEQAALRRDARIGIPTKKN